jgi:excisionase family DNA binding protein
MTKNDSTTNSDTSTSDSPAAAVGLTIPEAAAVTGLPARYIKRLVDEKRVAVYKLDRVRIDRASLDAFIANTRREAVAK